MPDGTVALSVGRAGAQKRYRAPSLWQLALAYPDAYKRHLFPLLTSSFRSCWALSQTLALETELLNWAAASKVPNRQRLTELIQQLGDDHFATREAADRELHALGQWVSWPLGNSTPKNSAPSRRFASSASSGYSTRASDTRRKPPNGEQIPLIHNSSASRSDKLPCGWPATRRLGFCCWSDPRSRSVTRPRGSSLPCWGSPLQSPRRPIPKRKRASESNCERSSNRRNATGVKTIGER